jgi:Tfp pilus assembly protein PilV
MSASQQRRSQVHSRNERAAERGLTLVEVLIAFFILVVITLAVLQLITLAYWVNLGAMIRTDLTYRAEQVVETIRLQRFLIAQGAAPNPCCPLNPGTTTDIPPGGCATDFWGPTGANIVQANSRYLLSYTVVANAGTGTAVTVLAQPRLAGANQYLGPTANKSVIYVAQLP